jgi:hypothetical protein
MKKMQMRVKEYYNAQELAEVMDIPLISAKELLDETIEFEADELILLADHKGISISALFCH